MHLSKIELGGTFKIMAVIKPPSTEGFCKKNYSLDLFVMAKFLLEFPKFVLYSSNEGDYFLSPIYRRLYIKKYAKWEPKKLRNIRRGTRHELFSCDVKAPSYWGIALCLNKYLYPCD
jgi:hypothetical protein